MTVYSKKKRAVWIAALSVGIFLSWLALFSENCIPYRQAECFARNDAENVVALIVGIFIATISIVKLVISHFNGNR